MHAPRPRSALCQPHSSFNGQSVSVNEVLPTPANQVYPCQPNSESPSLHMVSKVWSMDPWGSRETIFVPLFGVRRGGGKLLNTFNFYKLISSGRFVLHSVHSAQWDILLWILANHSSINLEPG